MAASTSIPDRRERACTPPPWTTQQAAGWSEATSESLPIEIAPALTKVRDLPGFRFARSGLPTRATNGPCRIILEGERHEGRGPMPLRQDRLSGDGRSRHGPLCHCTDCQTLTGSPFRANIQAPAASFVLLRGEPKIYIKTAESGSKRAHAFCPDCGTPMYASAISNPPSYSLRVGSIKQRRELNRPKRRSGPLGALLVDGSQRRREGRPAVTRGRIIGLVGWAKRSEPT